MVKSDDLRVKRTRKLISQAFFTLLRKKKFEKISIQEIADSAMINRATFYAHYADKQDLYDSLIDQFLASFTGILDEQNLVDGNNVHVKEIETVLSRFYEFVQDKPEVAQMITPARGNPGGGRRRPDLPSRHLSGCCGRRAESGRSRSLRPLLRGLGGHAAPDRRGDAQRRLHRRAAPPPHHDLRRGEPPGRAGRTPARALPRTAGRGVALAARRRHRPGLRPLPDPVAAALSSEKNSDFALDFVPLRRRTLSAQPRVAVDRETVTKNVKNDKN